MMRKVVYVTIVCSVLLGLASANLPQDPDFRNFDLFAICPMQTWANLTATYNVTGEAYLFISRANNTAAGRLNFNVSPGINNSDTFYAHVHAAPCAVNNGGGHFQFNMSNVNDTSDYNEYWFNFSQSGDGMSLTTNFSIDNWNPNLYFNANAKSIVIHYPKTKIACCDLKLVRRYAKCGSFSGFGNYSASGNASLYVTADGKNTAGMLNVTVTDVNGNGFLDNATFGSHVHNASCSVGNGGSHWKYNTSVANASITNEFWFLFGATGTGNYQASHSAVVSNTNFGLDGFIKSVVVHAPGGTKAACCDLTLEDSAASYANHLQNTNYDMIGYCTPGLFNNVNTDQSTWTVAGSAFLYVDQANTKSRGILNYTITPPLPADVQLVAHVHMNACADSVGGPHWKYNTTITGSIESNEFWFNPVLVYNSSTMSAYTAGTVSTTVALGKDAKSIILHQNGNKFSCCDLRYVSKFAYSSSTSWTALDGRVSVTGDVEVYMSDGLDSTVGDLNFQITPGLANNAYFEAHVHTDTCANGSGVHWKNDPSIMVPNPNNEIWWTYNGTGDGTLAASEYSIQMSNENFRPDQMRFKSVVIHAPKALGGQKVACADLTLTPLALATTPSPPPTTAAPTVATASPTLSASPSQPDKALGGKIAAAVLVPVGVIAIAAFLWQRKKSMKDPRTSAADVAATNGDDID